MNTQILNYFFFVLAFLLFGFSNVHGQEVHNEEGVVIYYFVNPGEISNVLERGLSVGKHGATIIDLDETAKKEVKDSGLVFNYFPAGNMVYMNGKLWLRKEDLKNKSLNIKRGGAFVAIRVNPDKVYVHNAEYRLKISSRINDLIHPEATKAYERMYGRSKMLLSDYLKNLKVYEELKKLPESQIGDRFCLTSEIKGRLVMDPLTARPAFFTDSPIGLRPLMSQWASIEPFPKYHYWFGCNAFDTMSSDDQFVYVPEVIIREDVSVSQFVGEDAVAK